jgi:hypothetical protein
VSTPHATLWRGWRTALVAAGLVAISTVYLAAQWIVNDPMTTAKNAAIAALKEQLLNVLTDENQQVTRMARRLGGLAANLERYALPDPPRWRTHPIDGDELLYAYPWLAALNRGDSDGAGYAGVARGRETPGPELTALQTAAPEAYAAIVSALATLDLADSSLATGSHQTGQLRLNGRSELAAIEQLMADVLDASPAQSATAVLDKISGGALLEGEQHETRTELLAAITEQFLVDNKRDRDTEAAVMNMQFGRLRYGTAANTAIVSGVADDLRTWRQP